MDTLPGHLSTDSIPVKAAHYLLFSTCGILLPAVVDFPCCVVKVYQVQRPADIAGDSLSGYPAGTDQNGLSCASCSDLEMETVFLICILKIRT